MRCLYALIIVVLLAGLLPPPTMAAEDAVQAAVNREFFGMVGRDPWYTLDVDGNSIADEPPYEFLDRMAADLARLGVTWVRIEFHAEINEPVGPGGIAYHKYDRFIREIAPRHGLKVLALLNSGILSDTDPAYVIERLNDPPDGAGTDPADQSNNYIRIFQDRARQIADHYGDAIAAYEIFNEPNINAQLYMRTNGRAQEIDAERFGTLMTNTYLAIKANHPRIPVILGGLLHGAPVEKPYRIPSDYLAEIYQSPRVQWYRAARPLALGNVFPWDGVGLHPYDLTPENMETHIREIKGRMASLGDPGTRIWITEIGKQAEPPPNTSEWMMPASPQEIEQATFMEQSFQRLLAMPDIVERVFWFKYEDFRENGLARNWGIVRLRENGQGQYDEAVAPYPRKPAYAVFQRFANPGALPTSRRPVTTSSTTSRYFEETGQAVDGVFLRYWERNGGLARFGLPRTAAFIQGGFLVQYFERARFEYHPEFAGTPNEIQLGHLGRQLVSDTALQASLPTSGIPGARYFPETGRTLANGFKAYWEQNDGLRLFGLPISDEAPERNPADGKIYAVQYFERARFEYHPEHKGTPFEIQLGLLGNQVLNEVNWYR